MTDLAEEEIEAPRPKTVEDDLREALIVTSQDRDKYRQQWNEARASIESCKKEIAGVYEKFNDLKTRLQQAEASNQYMRGYLARVQEDDTVREELVTTGDPEAPTLAPKRKPTRFERPSDFSHGSGSIHDSMLSYDDRERRKPKHWITY